MIKRQTKQLNQIQVKSEGKSATYGLNWKHENMKTQKGCFFAKILLLMRYFLHFSNLIPIFPFFRSSRVNWFQCLICLNLLSNRLLISNQCKTQNFFFLFHCLNLFIYNRLTCFCYCRICYSANREMYRLVSSRNHMQTRYLENVCISHFVFRFSILISRGK